MQNEIIDKLKNAGYITATDDSQGIADKVGVPGGGQSVFPDAIVECTNGLLPVINYIMYDGEPGEEKPDLTKFTLEGGITVDNNGLTTVSFEELVNELERVKTENLPSMESIDTISCTVQQSGSSNRKTFNVNVYNIPEDSTILSKLSGLSHSYIDKETEYGYSKQPLICGQTSASRNYMTFATYYYVTEQNGEFYLPDVSFKTLIECEKQNGGSDSVKSYIICDKIKNLIGFDPTSSGMSYPINYDELYLLIYTEDDWFTTSVKLAYVSPGIQ